MNNMHRYVYIYVYIYIFVGLGGGCAFFLITPSHNTNVDSHVLVNHKQQTTFICIFVDLGAVGGPLRPISSNSICSDGA